MSDSDLRDALLKHDPPTAVEAELEALGRLVRAEERRAQRLTRWTLAVWGAWVAVVVGSFVLYMALEQRAPVGPLNGAPADPATRPTTNPAEPSSSGGPVRALVIAAGSSLAAAVLLLPAIGVVLLVMMVLSRRSASTGRIRASLASIDAQLRILAMQSRTPPGGPPPSGAA